MVEEDFSSSTESKETRVSNGTHGEESKGKSSDYES